MKAAIIFIINGYQKLISQPIKQLFGGGCRFQPTCSQYAKEAVNKFGIIKGGGMAIKRLSKCHPLTNYQIDLVPEQ